MLSDLTRTVADADVPSLINSLRLPVIVGVGQEELEQDDLELVRGSSSTLDEQIINEDPAVRWVVDATNPSNPVLGATDGTITRLRVRNFPLVDGQGFGRITNDVRSVIVTVDGVPVAVGSVLGLSLETFEVWASQPSMLLRILSLVPLGVTVVSKGLRVVVPL